MTTDTRNGERFEFGKNWRRFLEVVDGRRIAAAQHSLASMLGVDDLSGIRFLDIGSGSGLSSLAARRLGARVHSFDYDPESVACTRELRHRFAADDEQWTIDEASVLDTTYLSTLGRFDVVYSWGVLHHTGDMWIALDNVIGLVAPNGLLFLAIYNDQGGGSRRWRSIKRAYVSTNALGRAALLSLVAMYLAAKGVARRIVAPEPLDLDYGGRAGSRGMSRWHDLKDWVGGYPFEVARPEAIVEFYRARGFVLERMTTCGGRHGCNEFVLQRQA